MILPLILRAGSAAAKSNSLRTWTLTLSHSSAVSARSILPTVSETFLAASNELNLTPSSRQSTGMHSTTVKSKGPSSRNCYTRPTPAASKTTMLHQSKRVHIPKRWRVSTTMSSRNSDVVLQREALGVNKSVSSEPPHVHTFSFSEPTYREHGVRGHQCRSKARVFKS